MVICWFIIGAFLRRLYGGMKMNNKVLENRTFQTICMIIAFCLIFIKDFHDIKEIIIGIAISLWLQFEFWSRGHGACFDIGRDDEPTKETIKRYNERWYHIPCDYLLKDHKYGFLYDFIYMTLRYTCPLLPLIFLSYKFLIIGLIVSFIYDFCLTLAERESWIFTKFLKSGWDLAEILVGGTTYSGCYLIMELL